MEGDGARRAGAVNPSGPGLNRATCPGFVVLGSTDRAQPAGDQRTPPHPGWTCRR